MRAEAGLPCTNITGDHAVAAVAVARAVGIVPPGACVYIGDVVDAGDGEAGGDAVAWLDGAGSGERLDPATLLPSRGSGGGDSVAAFCLALTGRTLRALRARVARGALRPRDLAAALLQARVLARMSPEDKAAAIEAMQATGLYIMMVGDGANDALALLAAHVGLALCAGADAAVSAPYLAARRRERALRRTRAAEPLLCRRAPPRFLSTQILQGVGLSSCGSRNLWFEVRRRATAAAARADKAFSDMTRFQRRYL
jgi:magnesium-transporting ATPase (P-type)